MATANFYKMHFQQIFFREKLDFLDEFKKRLKGVNVYSFWDMSITKELFFPSSL